MLSVMSSHDYLFGIHDFEPSALLSVIPHMPMDIPEVLPMPLPICEDDSHEHKTRRGVHVTSYGEITPKHKDCPKFHKRSYIYTIGFTSTKPWLSSKNISQKCDHTCEIIDGGQRPMFRVTASDRTDAPITATTPGGAWNAIKKRVNDNCPTVQEKYTGLISGTEYFGLFCETTISRCEKLDTEKVCSKYWDSKAQGYSVVGSKART